jgi:hypothetical protein
MPFCTQEQFELASSVTQRFTAPISHKASALLQPCAIGKGTADHTGLSACHQPSSQRCSSLHQQSSSHPETKSKSEGSTNRLGYQVSKSFCLQDTIMAIIIQHMQMYLSNSMNLQATSNTVNHKMSRRQVEKQNLPCREKLGQWSHCQRQYQTHHWP